jgi:hypothetical protein
MPPQHAAFIAVSNLVRALSLMRTLPPEVSHGSRAGKGPVSCVNAFQKPEEDRLGLLPRCLPHGRGFPGTIGEAAKVILHHG